MRVIDRLAAIEFELLDKDELKRADKIWLDAKFGVIRILEQITRDSDMGNSVDIPKPKGVKFGYLQKAVTSDPDMEDIEVLENSEDLIFRW